MTREQQLAEWKDQKAGRPAGGLANITNKPAQLAPVAVKPSVTFASEPEFVPDKENPTSVATRDAPHAEAPASVRKPALDGVQREQMEQQFDLLQGRLHSIKRESSRPSISGIPPRDAPPADPPAPSPAPSPAPAFARAATFGGLAAKLECLKRDSVRPSLAGPGAQQVQFEAAGQYDSQALSRLAQQMFGDPEFAALCARGMSAQLTRSKDGATEETKIKELAGEAEGAKIDGLRRAGLPPAPRAVYDARLAHAHPPTHPPPLPRPPVQAWSSCCGAG